MNQNLDLHQKLKMLKALAESIYKFSNLNDSKLKKELGKNARIYYEKEFERSRLIKRLIDIFEKMKDILVTGGAGFIGSNLI